MAASLSKALAFLFAASSVLGPLAFAETLSVTPSFTSFEEGDVAPKGWHARATGRWETGQARHGQRYLSARSSTGKTAWESDWIALEPQTDYRVEGWVRCLKGEARLGVEIRNAKTDPDQGLAALIPPKGDEAGRVRRGEGWRYVACEWNSASATNARVSFWVKGQADLDDVGVAPLAISFTGNGSLDVDGRGRIGLWSEEVKDSLVAGLRGGKFAADTNIAHAGQSSVRLSPSAEWCGFSTVNYGVQAWSDTIELSGWARCGESATAQILACWTDDQQTVLRADSGPSVTGKNWERISFQAPSAPEKAASVRLVAVARGGQVWFDDLDMRWLRPERRVMRIFVNQVGYDLAAPKTAVVAMNFLPPNCECRVALVKVGGQTDWKNVVPCSGRVHSGTADDWGWYFWRADFSNLRRAGDYEVQAQAGEVHAKSVRFTVGPTVLFKSTVPSAVDFFFVQRCGFNVPGWHKACHLDDAKLPDGTHIDATGGWHSAGDYNKLMYENGDGGVMFALLSAYRTEPRFLDGQNRDREGLPDILDEARWGAQFVAKMQIPETGGLRNHVSQGPNRSWTKWSAPEVHTDNVVGTEDDPVIEKGEGNSPLAIGGWAQLSKLLDERHVSNDYLNHARRLWDYATKSGTNVSSPQLLLSALELHGVTKDAAYLDYARRSAEALLAQQTSDGANRGAFGTFGELNAGALAQFALAHPKEPLVPKIKEALRRFTDSCLRAADNPFGLSTRLAGDAEVFFPPDLGNNFQLLMHAWAAASIYRLNRDPRALQFATDHVDWVLGKNPIGLCMFEGKGSFNPPRYHHRYNSIPGHERGAVPGTIPNGFVREMGLADRPGFDLSRTGGRSPSYRTSEPWLVHDMWYLMAMAELRRAGEK